MRFTGMGRDRKYEIPAAAGRRDTKYGIETNVERPVQNIEWKYKVPSTRYKVGIRIYVKIRHLKDLGTLYLVLRTIFNVLILATSYSILFLMSNAERPVQK
jgi:hypothetical protein